MQRVIQDTLHKVSENIMKYSYTASLLKELQYTI